MASVRGSFGIGERRVLGRESSRPADADARDTIDGCRQGRFGTSTKELEERAEADAGAGSLLRPVVPATASDDVREPEVAAAVGLTSRSDCEGDDLTAGGRCDQGATGLPDDGVEGGSGDSTVCSTDIGSATCSESGPSSVHGATTKKRGRQKKYACLQRVDSACT